MATGSTGSRYPVAHPTPRPMAPATAAGASRLAKLLTALASPRTAVVNRG